MRASGLKIGRRFASRALPFLPSHPKCAEPHRRHCARERSSAARHGFPVSFGELGGAQVSTDSGAGRCRERLEGSGGSGGNGLGKPGEARRREKHPEREERVRGSPLAERAATSRRGRRAKPTRDDDARGGRTPPSPPGGSGLAHAWRDIGPIRRPPHSRRGGCAARSRARARASPPPGVFSIMPSSPLLVLVTSSRTWRAARPSWRADRRAPSSRPPRPRPSAP